jgi:hypothetical protein
MDDSPDNDIPSFAELAADPEIAALLDFEPVERLLKKANGWTPGMQRMFIAWLAHYGSPGKAATELGKARSGIDKVYAAEGADSFRAAWNGAIALAEQRLMDRLATARSGAGALRPPSIPRTRPPSPLAGEGGDEGDDDAPEDAAELQRRAAEAGDSIANKLLRIRRIYLAEISADPGKRAAFEILTELPVDWDRAARLEPQPDEPYNIANQRQPDMILTAESGWSFGEIGYGPDRKAEARAAIDARRAKLGQEPIEWGMKLKGWFAQRRREAELIRAAAIIRTRKMVE